MIDYIIIDNVTIDYLCPTIKQFLPTDFTNKLQIHVTKLQQ